MITRRGVAVARLVGSQPAAAQRTKASAQRQRVRVKQAFAELTNLRRGVTLDIPLREAIEQGRD